LEVETDKASMDVEAQDDGVMAKIMVSKNRAVHEGY
jgi:pyruvate/2-oxoglutarate dehydrogenase complex dihydrolipoamide acyltransferase (E2) component